MKEADYKVEIFTGIRPSGGLTIANVIGSVHTIVTLQNDEEIGRPMVFVADLHALTDAEPKETQRYVLDVVKDYITLGLDPLKNDIFIQSQIVEEIGELDLYLSRLITISELMRVPTLKEKLKKGESENTANALLAMYPIMMASDILLQKSKFVPVGEDQQAHIEMARVLATKFNKRYGNVLVVPRILSLGKPIRVASLNSDGKMSKSNPSGAILLDDPIEISLGKIKKAQTAFAKEMSESLQALVTIGKFVSNEDERKKIEGIMERHMNGENVMGDLKGVISKALERYLVDFQNRKAKIRDEDVLEIVKRGGQLARKNAKETIKEVRKAMSLEYLS